jgi:hypothetical protein
MLGLFYTRTSQIIYYEPNRDCKMRTKYLKRCFFSEFQTYYLSHLITSKFVIITTIKGRKKSKQSSVLKYIRLGVVQP